MRTKFLSVFIVPLILASAALTWNEPEDFRGIKWKATPEEIASAVRAQWKKRREAGEIVLDAEIKEFYEDERVKTLYIRDKIGAVPVSLFFAFLDNQFTDVSIHFESKNYSAIKSAFKERYGPPHSEKQFTIKTKAGVEYVNERLYWAGPNIIIRLEQYGGKITDGIASIGDKRYYEYIAQREREKGKKGAKDL